NGKSNAATPCPPSSAPSTASNKNGNNNKNGKSNAATPCPPSSAPSTASTNFSGLSSTSTKNGNGAVQAY
ncbi:hypothetical protein Gpo141_00014103, partial [Globisporangium polare]